ncbi:MAG: glycoside hydrolase family 43 protein [Treponema sp.]|nr:glycoside hydrolase family 43 protein [Treponema sp.]
MKTTIKPFLVLLPAVLAAGTICSCATTAEVSMPGAASFFEDTEPPRFTTASVHDPSVFPADDGLYYVIGSHLATANTRNFMQWKPVTGDWNSRPNRFYPQDNPDPNVQTVQAQIADVMRGAKDALGFFASDIHKMPNGKFYHYYSITASWYCSAIGLAIADKAEGPYITQGLIVRSGEAADGGKTPDGSGSWLVVRHPNCIDPQAFFDNNGRFWLVYGSWSGGIFIYEMDPVTGMKKEGAALNAENGGYGRKLIRNNHTSIEGPYIIYSPETQYYYLFVSFGSLGANGGYNIRVFRSRSPAGPYDDAVYQDMGKNLKYTNFAEYGVNLMGGYQFKNVRGEPDIMNTAYLSPGHNSALRDPDTGKYLLIYHQRFAGRGEYHEVRVAEFFFNEDGWPVVSPFRYDGGTVRSFKAEDITGTWKLINHGKDVNTTPHQSQTYEFSADGTINGSGRGRWELGSDGKTARITVDGVLYTGVFLRCWDEDNKAWVQAFTALSTEGVALWGAGAVSK